MLKRLLLLALVSNFAFADPIDLDSDLPQIVETPVIEYTPHQSKILSKININTSNLNDLKLLPGVGPVKAQAILDYRSQNGNFKSCSDLDKVKGIGKKTVEKLKDLCTI